MPTLRPFRNYDEKDVVNFFAYSGTLPVNRGTVVKIQRGYVASDEPLQMLGSVGQSYNNTVSQRYGAYAQVAQASSTDTPFGILLMDVRETDENGELLKFRPTKLAEMDAVLSGQAVPIARRGIFHYSGAILTGQTPTAAQQLYVLSGELTTGQTLKAFAGGVGASGTYPAVGITLGTKDTNGCVVVDLDFTNVVN